MKKLISLLLALLIMPGLSGCGSIYTNFRELEQLLVIQTLGIDYLPGGVQLTLSSVASKAPDPEPACLCSNGSSIATALENARNYSNEEAIFFAHINHILLGETAARQGIGDYLNYICRSPDVRIDMPMYLVRSSTAKELMISAGNGSTGISEILQAVDTNLKVWGKSHVFTAADILRSLERYGGALICAVEPAPAAEQTLHAQSTSAQGAEGDEKSSGAAEGDSGDPANSAGEEITAAVAGYGVLKSGKLCAYIDRDEAVGVGFLTNNVGVSDIIVRDINGCKVTLEISQGRTRLEPLWDDEGSLYGISVEARAQASIIEISGGELPASERYYDYLTSRLEAEVSSRIGAVLQLSKNLETDFLGLAGRLEAAAPERFRTIGGSFPEHLPELEIIVSVSGEMSHSNDIEDS